MEAKKLLALAAAVVTLAIAGPAVAFGAGSGDDTRPAAGSTAPVVDPQTENEQESGEKGDVENADLATQVEAADDDANDPADTEPGGD